MTDFDDNLRHSFLKEIVVFYELALWLFRNPMSPFGYVQN